MGKRKSLKRHREWRDKTTFYILINFVREIVTYNLRGIGFLRRAPPPPENLNDIRVVLQNKIANLRFSISEIIFRELQSITAEPNGIRYAVSAQVLWDDNSEQNILTTTPDGDEDDDVD